MSDPVATPIPAAPPPVTVKPAPQPVAASAPDLEFQLEVAKTRIKELEGKLLTAQQDAARAKKELQLKEEHNAKLAKQIENMQVPPPADPLSTNQPRPEQPADTQAKPWSRRKKAMLMISGALSVLLLWAGLCIAVIGGIVAMNRPSPTPPLPATVSEEEGPPAPAPMQFQIKKYEFKKK